MTTSLQDAEGNDSDYNDRSLSTTFYTRTSQATFTKQTYSGEGAEAAKCAKFLATLSASLKAGDRRVYDCFEGKAYLLTNESFVAHAYQEAAEALLAKHAAEGYPPGLFYQHAKLELSKIRVEATQQAVAAANALILKEVEGCAIRMQRCFTGKALDTISTLGTSNLRSGRLCRASPTHLPPSRCVESAGRAETGTGLTGAFERPSLAS